MSFKTITTFKRLPALPAWFAVSGVILAAGSALVVFAGEYKHFESRIAFIQPNASTPGGDVYTMNPHGSDVRQLTNLGANNGAFWENWSADGKQLVFVEYPNNGPGQLWLMDADGTHQHLLLSEADYGENAPSFSPDGAWVIFTRCQNVSNGNGCAIYKIQTNGCGLTPVTNFQLEVGDWEPVYSPDSMTIAFDSFGREGLIAAIWLMNADGSDFHPLTPPELVAINPQWSRDGEKIVFRSHCCNPQNNDIWTINRDGSGLTRLTGSASSDVDIPVAYYDEAPSWSPHGYAVGFDQYDVKTNTVGIFVIKADGSGKTQLMKFSAPPRKAALAMTDESRRKKRHHGPHEIEMNGFWPRWSPELQ
jgi:Tol biopolymer transport system component